ncbi:hypothetical protein P0D73_33390 [Paraburkholderia sp. RL18-101-BIB-B]|uniref:MFS transporter n=1 Tax=Paraburkholderia sp. RL18-101-BIB-B TaxID=3031634 RepID=UPI0038B83840
MEKLVLALAGMAPLTAVFSSARERRRTLSVILFGLATLACLSVALPELAPGWPRELTQRVALLHPVLLAGAVSSACSYDTPRTAFWKGVFTARMAAFGLLLGLPMATWLSTSFPRSATFSLMSCVTAVVGIWMVTRRKSRRASRAQYGGRSIPVTRKSLSSILSTVLQYAAMFAVFSNALFYLMDQPAFDETSAAFMMVVFGIGGVLGAMLSGRLLAGHSTLAALLQPLALAVCYLLLFVFGQVPGVAAAIAVVLWGATHTAGMVITRSLLVALAPRAQEVANALHVSAGCAGVMLGVSLATVFTGAYGSMGILLCGFVLAIASLVAATGQLADMDTPSLIVARDSTD